jgi:hypothetical protein
MSDDGDSADDRLYGFGPEDYIRFPTLNEQEVAEWELRFNLSTECTGCGEGIDTDDIWFAIDYYDPASERAYCTSCWKDFWKEEGRSCQACESNGDNSPAVTSLALCARHADGNSFENGCGICDADGFVQSFPDECCNGMLGACPTCQSLYDGAEPLEKKSDEDEKQAISARRVQQGRERTRRAHQDAATKGAIAPYRPAAQATRAPRDETAPHENRARNMRDMALLRKAYPRHCTHHLFHHHVLGRQHGCNRGEEPSCTIRGRTFLHERPRGFDEWAEALEAYQ